MDYWHIISIVPLKAVRYYFKGRAFLKIEAIEDKASSFKGTTVGDVLEFWNSEMPDGSLDLVLPNDSSAPEELNLIDLQKMWNDNKIGTEYIYSGMDI